MGVKSNLEWAVYYADKLGWAVFPCHSPRGGRCSCGKPIGTGEGECTAKHPRTPNGFKDATTDLEQIKKWWEHYPDASIGTPTPAVLDVEAKKKPEAPDGVAQYGLLQQEHSLDFEPPQALTGRYNGQRGIQQYFAPGAPTGLVAPGIEIRGDGSYVLLPPSLHFTGVPYEWVTPPRGELRPLPEWLHAKSNGTNGGGLGDGPIARGDLTHAEALEQRPGLAQIVEAAQAKRTKVGWELKCPVHNGNGHTSLFITAGDTLDYVVKCHSGCAPADIIRKLGVKPAAGVRQEDAVVPNEEPAAEDAAPWTGDALELASAVSTYLNRYVVLGDAELTICTLWIFHTHLFDAFEITPYLHVHSATKRCGKSRLMLLLRWLSAGGFSASMGSDATLYRKLQMGAIVTMFIDEADEINWKDRELLGIINLGFEHGNTIPRVNKDKGYDVDDIPTFCPKAIAGIGGLPRDTLTDRCIRIEMLRKAASLKKRMRQRKARREAEILNLQLCSFAGSVDLNALGDLEPKFPPGLDDRAEDLSEPLLAVAELLGGPWPKLAREAAAALLADRDEDNQSLEEDLLRRIQAAFAGEIEEQATADLITLICADEESPWRGWWWDAKEMKPNTKAARQFGQRLKHFKIKSKKLRIEGVQKQGYLRADFEPIWERYFGGSFTPENRHQSHHPHQAPHDQAVSEESGGSGDIGDSSPGVQPVPGPIAVNTPALVRDGRCIRHPDKPETWCQECRSL